MSERKDEKWLDDQLKRAVNSTEPAFDAEAWKRTYSKEYQVLLSRSAKPASATAAGHGLRLVLTSSISKFAVAAAIVVAVGLFVSRSGRKPDGPVGGLPPVAESPVEMLSMMSLRMAYERGGLEALDRQFQDTLDMFGPRSLSMSMQELSEGVNGS